MLRPSLNILVLMLLLPLGLVAQNPTNWKLQIIERKEFDFRSGDRFQAGLEAEIEPGWHLYATDQPAGGPIPTTISVSPGSPFNLSGPVAAPKPTIKFDPNFNIETKFFENRVTLSVPLVASRDAKREELGLDVRFQLCNDTFCLPPKTVGVTSNGTEDVKRSQVSGSSSVSGSTPRNSNAAGEAGPSGPLNEDIWSFIWLAATLGALSLLTPCVFPMIPITVSYFTNHSAGHRSKSIRLATVYSVGIIATFTLLGMVLALFVGAAGINLFAANPWVNLLITAVFLFFAFNLFGAYEINVPTHLLTSLDRITRSHEGEGSGVIGALLMGLTFTLTSFTCTSPFVGTILVSASQGNWRMPLAGMLAYSTVFALPFFILALVPQWVAQLPRAGSWMNSVKVAMGFLEVAAALKFLSNVDLVWKWGIFTRSIVLALWVAIGVILSLYLLGKFQLSHDSKPERIGAFRLVCAIVALGISFYLLTGLFGAKLGEIEAFLPPDLSASASTIGNSAERRWITNDLEAAQQKAASEGKPIFVDFTGYTCTNCRWMEANIFPLRNVDEIFGDFVLLRLYTDGEGEIYEKQQRMEEEMFGTVALPYYAVLDAEGKALGTFPGLTRNVDEFVGFLKNAQAKHKADQNAKSTDQ